MSAVTSPDGTVIAYDRLGSGEPLVLVGGSGSSSSAAASATRVHVLIARSSGGQIPCG